MEDNISEKEISLVNFIKKMRKNNERMGLIITLFMLLCEVIMIAYIQYFFSTKSLIFLSFFTSICGVLIFLFFTKIIDYINKKQTEYIIDYEIKNFDGVLIFNIERNVKDISDGTEYIYLVRKLYEVIKKPEPNFDFLLTFNFLKIDNKIKIKVPEKFMVDNNILFIKTQDFYNYFLPFINKNIKILEETK